MDKEWKDLSKKSLKKNQTTKNIWRDMKKYAHSLRQRKSSQLNTGISVTLAVSQIIVAAAQSVPINVTKAIKLSILRRVISSATVATQVIANV